MVFFANLILKDFGVSENSEHFYLPLEILNTDDSACFKISERGCELWLVGQITAAPKEKKNEEMTVLELFVEPPHTPLHSPSHSECDALCLHGNLIHKYTQRYGKRERGIEQAKGCCVILLKVCVFNWLVFMSSFVVRVHSSGLQRQVGQKLSEQSWGRRSDEKTVQMSGLESCCCRIIFIFIFVSSSTLHSISL